MRRTFYIFLFSFLLSALRFPAFAQEMPFIHFPNSQLEGREVLAFQQNDNKEVLFVTHEGVYSFNGRYTQRIFDFERKQLSGISKAFFSAGRVFVLSEEGLFQLDLNKKGIATVRKGSLINVFFHPENGDIYYEENRALYHLKEDGKLKQLVKEVGPIRFLEAGKEEIFVVGEKSIRTYTPEWTLKESVALPGPVLDSYFKNGRLLLLTAEHILSKEGEAGLKKIASVQAGESGTILEDQTGQIWVGSKNQGVLLFDGSQHTVLNHENNFPLSELNGIYEGPDLSLWFFGKQGIVYKPFSAPFLKFTVASAPGGEKVDDIHAIDSGTLAILTNKGGYRILKNEKFQEAIRIPLPFVPHFSHILDNEKTIHISKGGDLFLYDKGKGYRSFIQNADIRQVYSFNPQTVLLDAKGEVFSFNHQSRKINKKNLGLSVLKPHFRSGDFLVYTDEKNRIRKWDSRQDNHEIIGEVTPEMIHIALFQEKNLVFLNKDQQLKYAVNGQQKSLGFKIEAEEKVASFFISGTNLWISTGEKLYQLKLGGKEKETEVQDVRVFKVEENNIQLPVLESFVAGEENTVWLMSSQSLMLYNSLAHVPDITPPGIVLSKLTITGKDSVQNVPFNGQDSIKINLKKAEQLLIHSFAVNYNRKANASVAYRFLSDESERHRSSGSDYILFSGLPAGSHLVELRAVNEEGVKSIKRILFAIEVEQEAWYSWWSLLGASLGLMMVGFIAYNGVKSVKDARGKETRERYEKELQKLQKKGHEQMMKAEGLKQVNELITAQKVELEEKNKQIVAQKYELSLTNNQIKQQKDLIEKTSEKLQSSINYAQKIQTALMADEIQIKEDLPDSFVFFKPRDQVSGDFFWFDKVRNTNGEETLIIGAVDCTGHGVPGAIVSVVGIQLLNAIVKAKGITDPGHILTQLNLDMLESLKYEQTKINDGMDMSLCSIQLSQKKLLFAGAKNPLFIVEKGELEVIKGDKFPIGGQKLKDEKIYQTHEIVLKGNGEQMFYLFSDGYQDQFGGAGNSKFLSRSFKDLLVELSDKPMMEQKYMLAKTLREWQGEESQTDDILVMGFRI